MPAGRWLALETAEEQPVEGWLLFLESHPNVYGDLHDSCVKLAEKRLAELKSKLQKEDSNRTGY
jgi:hypothetical protein